MKTQKAVNPYASIQVIDRVVNLLDVIARYGEPPSLKLLSAETGLHTSTAFRILASLESHGLVERNRAGRYGLGPKLLRLGGRDVHDERARAQVLRDAGLAPRLAGEDQALDREGRRAEVVAQDLDALPDLPPSDRCQIASTLLRRWSPSAQTDWRTWSRARDEAWDTVRENEAMLRNAACSGMNDGSGHLA